MIILFSQNTHKIQEIQAIFGNDSVQKYSDFIPPFEVNEDGNSFKDNAIIKLRNLSDKLPHKIAKDSLLMSEDSGICIEALDNKPGIYSARFANISDFGDKNIIRNAKDAKSSDNIIKVVNELKALNLAESNAFFVSCVAVLKNGRYLTTHGILSGKVITEIRGNNGFGYDPIFIPNGYDKTLGELDSALKDSISHRFKALNLMRILL